MLGSRISNSFSELKDHKHFAKAVNLLLTLLLSLAQYNGDLKSDYLTWKWNPNKSRQDFYVLVLVVLSYYCCRSSLLRNSISVYELWNFIICGPIWGSFPVWESFAVGDHLRRYVGQSKCTLVFIFVTCEENKAKILTAARTAGTAAVCRALARWINWLIEWKKADKQIKMTDLQFVDIPLMPGPVRRENQFILYLTTFAT